MRVRATRETIFEVPDDTTLEILEDKMQMFSQGVWAFDEIVDQNFSWCILTPEGLPIPPSQYPKR